MPRQPKPFFHRGGWYTDAGGTRTLLAEGKENHEQAQKALAKHLLNLQRKRESSRQSNPGIRLKQLVDLFLDDIQLTSEEKTYSNYVYGLRKAVAYFGNPKVTSIKRQDVIALRKKLAGEYGPATVNRVLRCVKRLYNWANYTEVLDDYNPAGKVELLEEFPRSRLMTPVEFELLLEHSSVAFKDVLIALRYTSARPGEIRKLQWTMVDWQAKVWVLPRHKSSRTARVKKPRTIAFPPIVEEVLRRLQAHEKDNPYVFLNGAGRPWKAQNFSYRFCRARQKAGLGPDEQGEELVPYSTRHTLLTQAVRNGATGPQLQLLGGWTNLETARHYIHLGEHDVYQAGLKAAEGIEKMDRKRNDG
jgi:site-specific recombinase XerD